MRSGPPLDLCGRDLARLARDRAAVHRGDEVSAPDAGTHGRRAREHVDDPEPAPGLGDAHPHALELTLYRFLKGLGLLGCQVVGERVVQRSDDPLE
jgi:hypothetical protein